MRNDAGIVFAIDISIHALTRSATILQERFRKTFRISIHALTRSATGRFLLSLVLIRDFNPRTHEECDTKATDDLENKFDFNPRTHEECDDASFATLVKAFGFQSTHSRGVRPKRRGTHCYEWYFNPRTHEECDNE